MRLIFLVILFLFSSLAEADWTGVAFDLGDYETDWKFDSGVREAQISSISFQIEERTDTNLSVGAGIGYFDIRIVGNASKDSRSFDGQYFEIYLRQDIPLGDIFALHGSLSYRYNSGDDGDEDDRAEIDWSQTRFQFGASFRFPRVRITPYAAYTDIDGDVDDDDGTDVFESDEPLSHGVQFDYFVEETAFIRLEFHGGGQTGVMLTFVRRY